MKNTTINLSGKQQGKKIKHMLITILIIIIVGFIAFIFISDYFHEKKEKAYMAQLMAQSFGHSESKSIDNSASETQKCYYLLSEMCDLYITNDTLTQEQVNDLTLKLHILCDEVKRNILDNKNTLSKYDNNNILNDFNDQLLDELKDLTDSMESFFDKTKEKIPTQAEIDQFFDDLHYFEDLFVKTSN